MAITQIIATLPAVLNDSAAFYEDIAERNNSLVTTVLPSINVWTTQANTTQIEINAKAAQVAAQAVDGGYSQDYINSNFIGVNNAQKITAVKTFTSSPIVPTPILGGDAVNKDYVDNLRTIATGTAIFTATTNNINLTGIGAGVEIGDVIQISGAEDAKNNSEFTIEVITDNDNIIVNQAHSNKGTSKNLAARSSDTVVAVKLLAKWHNAPSGLGQDWVEVTSSRVSGTLYLNNTKRSILTKVYTTGGGAGSYLRTYINTGSDVLISEQAVADASFIFTDDIFVTSDCSYKFTAIGCSIAIWSELR